MIKGKLSLTGWRQRDVPAKEFLPLFRIADFARFSLESLMVEQVQLSLGLLHVYTFAQSGKEIEPLVVFERQALVPLSGQRHWRSRTAYAQPTKPGRSDADNGTAHILELDNLADDGWIQAKTPLPIGITDHGDRRFTGKIIVRYKHAATVRRHAQQRVNIGTEKVDGHRVDAPIHGHGDGAVIVRDQSRQRVIVVAQL